MVLTPRRPLHTFLHHTDGKCVSQVVHTISVTDILEDKGTAKALGVGKKTVMCRCWKSVRPLPAARVKHNKETGDNVGPLIIDNDASKAKGARFEHCLVTGGQSRRALAQACRPTYSSRVPYGP